MRGSRDIISQGHWGVLAEEYGAGKFNLIGQHFRFACCQMEMFGSQLVHAFNGLGRIASRHEGAEMLQTLLSQFSPRQLSQLSVQGGVYLVDQRLVPGDENAGTR